MGTHQKVLGESYPMNTNMTGFRRFSKIFCFFVLSSKVASALEGLTLRVPGEKPTTNSCDCLHSVRQLMRCS